MSTQLEERKKAEEDVRHRWRGFPALTSTILAAVRRAFDGQRKLEQDLKPDEALRVRHFYAARGCPIPD